MNHAGLDQIQRDLENLSQHCLQPLTAPLQTVAVAVGELRKVPYPSDGELARAYSKALESTPTQGLAPEAAASALGIVATRQFQAALKLYEVVKVAWDAVQTERGSN